MSCWTASVCISRSRRCSCKSRASTCGLVERIGAAHDDLAGRHPIEPVLAVQAERDALDELVLAHRAAGGQREHVLVVDDTGTASTTSAFAAVSTTFVVLDDRLRASSADIGGDDGTFT